MNHETQSLCFQLPNLPGTLEPVITALANAGVNVENIIATAGILNLTVDKPALLRDVLRSKGIRFQETTACAGDVPSTTGDLAREIQSLVAQLNELTALLDRDNLQISDMPGVRRDALLRIAGDLSALAALGSPRVA